jgi:hypothetical protein
MRPVCQTGEPPPDDLAQFDFHVVSLPLLSMTLIALSFSMRHARAAIGAAIFFSPSFHAARDEAMVR